MACLFCNSLYHLTQNCKQFPSDESRKQFFYINNICQTCLMPLDAYVSMELCCNRWDFKCYICLSKNHNLVFCEHRTKFELYIPKIDADLQPRFFQTFDIIEKYSLAFSSPKYSNFFKPKGIAVSSDIDESNISKYSENKDLLMGRRLLLKSNDILPLNLSNLLASRTFTINYEILEIINFRNFPAELFFLLITPSILKVLKCANVAFDSVMSVSEILSQNPNIEEMELRDTNVKFHGHVPVFLNFNKNLKKIFHNIGKIDFEKGKLTDFLVTDTKLYSKITLEITELFISNLLPIQSILTNLIHSNLLIIASRKLMLSDIPNFPPQLFLYLLSPFMEQLTCKNVTFDSSIKFSEILSKSPKIQEMELANTNIEMEKSWPVELLKFRRTLTKLSLKLDNFDFDFGKLAGFMKRPVDGRMGTKSDCFIFLNICQAQNTLQNSAVLENLISRNFVPFDIEKTNPPVLSINYTINVDSKSSTTKTFLLSPA